MAIVQSPIIGAARGKAGGAIFQRYNGFNIIRKLPLVYIDANTQAQQIARSSFKANQIKIDRDPLFTLDNIYINEPRNHSKYTEFANAIRNSKKLRFEEKVSSEMLPFIGDISSAFPIRFEHNFTSFGSSQIRLNARFKTPPLPPTPNYRYYANLFIYNRPSNIILTYTRRAFNVYGYFYHDFPSDVLAWSGLTPFIQLLEFNGSRSNLLSPFLPSKSVPF